MGDGLCKAALMTAALCFIAGCSQPTKPPGFYRNVTDPTVYRLQADRIFCTVTSMAMLNRYGGIPVVHAVSQSVASFTAGYAPADPVACGWPDGTYRKPTQTALAGSFYRNTAEPTVYMLQADRTYCVVTSMQMLDEYGGLQRVHAVNQTASQFTRGYRPEKPLACGSPRSIQHEASAVFRIDGGTICAESRTPSGHLVDVDQSVDLSVHKHFTGTCTHE